MNTEQMLQYDSHILVKNKEKIYIQCSLQGLNIGAASITKLCHTIRLHHTLPLKKFREETTQISHLNSNTIVSVVVQKTLRKLQPLNAGPAT